METLLPLKPGLSDEQKMRIYKRIVDKCYLRLSTGCMEYRGGSPAPNGYGRARVHGRLVMVHRVVAAIAYPDWDHDKHPLIRHTCDNPPCCNPDHLIPGTQLENMRDMYERGRRG